MGGSTRREMAEANDHEAVLTVAVAVAANDDAIADARRDIREKGFARVPWLVADTVKTAVAGQVVRLLALHSRRRDLACPETGGTPRRMRNVAQRHIAKSCPMIAELYRRRDLLDAMSVVVGEPVFECPYEPERFVITCLERGGDTHGWHWDDYRYALVWLIENGPTGTGGLVQAVPATRWDKRDPRVEHYVERGPVHTLELAAGDLYLMRTDTTLHRVTPLTSGRRVILNMAYAGEADLARPITHETMDALWAD